MTFGERLKQLREETGMSLREVAKRTGITATTVYRYETGAISNVPPEKVHQLANLFSVTRPYLMGWTEERNANPDVNLDMVAEMLRNSGKDSDVPVWHPASTSDCTTAATQALRALVKFKISRTPIYPQQILQASSLATIVTHDGLREESEFADGMVLSLAESRQDGSPHYIFSVDRDAPIGELCLTLAVHIGHIYLGHTGNQKECTRRQEAECFAVHLRYPRPMIRLLTERGYVFTKETFSRIFGYCDPCLESMLNANPVSVSPELNRLVKEQFTPYVNVLDEMGILKMGYNKEEKVLDFSRYMAGYEE